MTVLRCAHLLRLIELSLSRLHKKDPEDHWSWPAVYVWLIDLTLSRNTIVTPLHCYCLMLSLPYCLSSVMVIYVIHRRAPLWPHLYFSSLISHASVFFVNCSSSFASSLLSLSVFSSYHSTGVVMLQCCTSIA